MILLKYVQPIQKNAYHVININEVEWGNLQRGSNYHSTLFDPQTKEMTFALFIEIARLWKGNDNNVSFVNIHMLNHHFPLYLMIQDS